MRMIITPEVDMLLVSRSSSNQRKSIMNFAPRIGLSVVDYGRSAEIDNFYISCQNFRDYYRDPYNKLPRPIEFKRFFGKCGNRCPDRNTELLMKPTQCVREKQPIIYPLNYGRNLTLDEGIRLGGQYDPGSCIKYKR